MALVCEVAAEIGSLATYNVHLESRGNDELRTAQLVETLDDARRSMPLAPVLIAGDFNFDLASGRTASMASRRGFFNSFTVLGRQPTITGRREGRSASIDSMLVTSDLQANHATVHDSISASDHYPLSVQLRWS